MSRFFLTVALAALSISAMAAPMMVGTAKVDLTPSKMPFLAGTNKNRVATSVNDPVEARALVIESQGTRIALVSVDLIGLFKPGVDEIRNAVTNVPKSNILISCSHTHSGPDSMGLWGPNDTVSGVDRAWYADVKKKIALCIDAAATNMRPAVMKVARITGVEGVSRNPRVPQNLDTSLVAMQFINPVTNGAIAVWVNFACHPESVMYGHELTSDFPHYMRQKLEANGYGMAMFANGALGGMVTTLRGATNLADTKIYGEIVADKAMEALNTPEQVNEPVIKLQTTELDIPLENAMFIMGNKLGLFAEKHADEPNIKTVISRLTLGPVEFCAMPGEALPNVGWQMQSMMKGKYNVVLGLTNDELGYILSEADYDIPLYKYETTVSTGRKTAHLLADAYSVMAGPKAQVSSASIKPLTESVQAMLKKRFKADRAKDENLMVRMNLSGKIAGVWDLSIKNSQIQLMDGPTEATPDLTLGADYDDLVGFFTTGKADLMTLMLTMKIDGDPMLLMRLAGYFM
ncbi:MAG: SCP2 sterol-binding domain-containing protein [Armatimonadota bacterium]